MNNACAVKISPVRGTPAQDSPASLPDFIFDVHEMPQKSCISTCRGTTKPDGAVPYAASRKANVRKPPTTPSHHGGKSGARDGTHARKPRKTSHHVLREHLRRRAVAQRGRHAFDKQVTMRMRLPSMSRRASLTHVSRSNVIRNNRDAANRRLITSRHREAFDNASRSRQCTSNARFAYAYRTPHARRRAHAHASRHTARTQRFARRAPRLT